MARRPADYSVIKRPGSPYWYYRLEGETKYSPTKLKIDETTEAEARSWAAREWKANRRADPETLGDYAGLFYGPDCPHLARIEPEGRTVTEKYRVEAQSIIKRRILKDPIAKIRLAQVAPEAVLAYRRRLIAKEGRTRSVQVAMRILGTILKEAVIQRLIPYDPTAGLGEIKKAVDRTPVPIPSDDLAKLFGALPGPWPTMQHAVAFLLAFGCGLRRNEVLGLMWDRVGVDSLTVDQALVKTRKGNGWEWKPGPPKWGRTRVVPLPAVVSKAIDTLPIHGEYVFSRKDNGHHWTPTWWRKGFLKGLAAAKLESKRVTPHSLRHTYATILRSAGVELAGFQGALGHRDATTTAHYSQKAIDTRIPGVIEQALNG